MDLRHLLVGAITAAAIGCGAPPASKPLAPGQSPNAAAVAMRHHSAPSRGRLAYDVSWTADGARLVSVELALSFHAVSRAVGASSKMSSRRVRLGDPTYDVVDVAVTGDGRAAWVASLDGSVRELDLMAGAVLRRWPIGDPVTAVDVSADGSRVLLGTATGVVCLRRAADAALLQCVAAHGGRVSAIRFATDGTRAASVSWDGSATLWKVPSLAVVAQRRVPGSINDAAFSPDGRRLALARSHRPPIRTPEVAARERKTTHTRALGSVVELWQPGAVPVTCSGHVGPVTGVSWTADGKRVLSVSWDRTIRMWDASSCRQVSRLGGFGGPLQRISTDHRGRFAAVAGWAGGLKDRSTAIVELLYPSTPTGAH